MEKPGESPPLGQGAKGRLVVDYRAANRATKRKLAVMTDQWGMIREAATSFMMTLADAYSGFSHLVVGSVAKSLTVMATSLGLIEWDTMPQDGVNGPVEFQNAMNFFLLGPDVGGLFDGAHRCLGSYHRSVPRAAAY